MFDILSSRLSSPLRPIVVSENKVLCHPSSVDSITTSAGTEDHVSMGGFAARKALKVVENVEKGNLCACFVSSSFNGDLMIVHCFLRYVGEACLLFGNNTQLKAKKMPIS